MKTAIFAGSFNPWHQGHQSILDKALNLFDQVIVLVAINPQKSNQDSLKIRFSTVTKLIQSSRVKVDYLESGFVADYASAYNVLFLVRGVRNQQDFELEFNLAKINKGINPDLETILLMPDQEFKKFSSSQKSQIIL